MSDLFLYDMHGNQCSSRVPIGDRVFGHDVTSVVDGDFGSTALVVELQGRPLIIEIPCGGSVVMSAGGDL